MKHQFINLVLFITLATRAAELFITSPYNIPSSTLFDNSDRRRQVAQPAQPTLPSNYWWPYPSLTWGGGGTSTVTATVPATTVMPSTMIASVSSLSVSSDSTSTSTLGFSSSSTTSTSSSSSISDISTTTVDPQQTNSTSHSHVSHLTIPIIASIAGAVVVICVLILLLCRCCTRRRREHTTRRTLRRRRDRGDAEKGWRRVSIDKWEDNQRQQRSWWNTLFSTRSEEVEDVIPGPRYVGVDEVERPLVLGGDEVRVADRIEGQPQDELSSARSIRRPNPFSSQPLISSRSLSTTALCALAELDNDESVQAEEDYDKEQVPWESLRHKSIKRAILAKVDEEKKWTDSMRGVRAANANAAKVGRRQTHIRCDSDFWVDAGGGFRIVAESPPPQLPTPQSKPWMSLASSFPFLTSGADEEDRYTPAPARMRSNSKSRSRRGSITSPMRVAGAFMRSPPTVMSPEMESALCFTPVLSASTSNWASFDHPEYVGNVSSDDVGGSRRAHDRFRDSVTNFRPGQEQMQGQRSRDDGAAGTAFTKTYRLRTDRALKRVEAIVESGWTERGVASRIVKDTAAV